MDSLVAVDELRHAEVARERAQHVSFVASKIGARAYVLDHFSNRLPGRVIKILVKANRHQVCRIFGEGPFYLHNGFVGLYDVKCVGMRETISPPFAMSTFFLSFSHPWDHRKGPRISHSVCWNMIYDA